jgi:peptide chain release factor 3
MTFERDGIVFNLLDTPGHEDFSEDTYRTLTAVDSAIMVIDAPRVSSRRPASCSRSAACARCRSSPSSTRWTAKAATVFDLLDEVADVLALDVSPQTWPVGMGGLFEGILDLATGAVSRPEGDSREFLGKVEANAVCPPKSPRKWSWHRLAIPNSIWMPIAAAT